MLVSDENISLYVLIDCEAHSRHRDPQGVYRVDLVAEESLVHCACAAIQVAKSAVAFLEENLEKAVLRVFSHDGNEIKIPVPVDSKFYEMGFLHGRVEDFPEIITLQ